jgi:hypothetical protein
MVDQQQLFKLLCHMQVHHKKRSWGEKPKERERWVLAQWPCICNSAFYEPKSKYLQLPFCNYTSLDFSLIILMTSKATYFELVATPLAATLTPYRQWITYAQLEPASHEHSLTSCPEPHIVVVLYSFA